MNRKEFGDFILNSEDILMEKVLEFAKEHSYTKYTSTLKEAWRLSISGLSKALIKAAENTETAPEMGPDDDYTRDGIAEFGIIEAKKHRNRGITLGMFLSLMKYYRQAYIDLIKESNFTMGEKENFIHFIVRYFDHVELGFTVEWSGLSKKQELEELQENNRRMTNEKNKYLTIFESIYDPIILIDQNDNIENMNYRAAQLFGDHAVSGRNYYSNIDRDIRPKWLKEEMAKFSQQDTKEIMLEKAVDTRDGHKIFMVKLMKMLDFSERYKGTVVILYDVTERMKNERELKKQHAKLETYAFTDQLTGVSNRRIGIMALKRDLLLLKGKMTPLTVCFIDIDGLKAVNDTFGHREGDKLIKLIAASIKNSVTCSDTVSRMGGDEFLIICPDSSEADVKNLIQKIYLKVAEYEQKLEAKYKHEFSYGILEIPCGSNLNVSDALKIVDKKMYQNKFLKKQVKS